jgi:protein-L-isoaspartate(D-aspartate) O-methyltransferase
VGDHIVYIKNLKSLQPIKEIPQPNGRREMKIIFFSLSLIILLAGCRAPAEVTRPPDLTQSPSSGDHQVTLTAPVADSSSCTTSQDDPYLQQRLDMVKNTIENRGVGDPSVLKAMRCTHRHEFVPDEYLDQAYNDHPLPIGYGQTISQPYIVAWMTELIELQPGESVLEIGTGSGYQAAVLADLGDLEIYSIEIVPELAASAAGRLEQLGYTQVQLKQGDGYYGWSEEMVFDAILVTAAPNHVPAPLAAQLAEGGRMVIPIGPQGGFQTLWKFVKEGGELTAYNMGGVRFVPFTGEGAEMGPSLPLP